MAIIPNGEQFRSNPEGVDLTNRGNSLVKKNNNIFTMEDIVETVENSIGSSEPYVKVVFNIKQNGGTSNPEVTVLENTTGRTIDSVRYITGNYRVTLSSPISITSDEKVVVLTGLHDIENSAQNDYNVIIQKGPAPYFDRIVFNVYDPSGNSADGINRDVELRIYT